MVLNILRVVFPSIALLASVVSLVSGIIKHDRSVILKDIAIFCLCLSLIIANLQYIGQ